MKEKDPFERIEWTPPIFGWQYHIDWTLEHHDRRRVVALEQRIWVGFSDREYMPDITIYARIEPKIRSHWGITITTDGGEFRIQRASSSLQRAVDLIEEEAERLKELLRMLTG